MIIKVFLPVVVIVTLTFIFCEFLIYYLVLFQCSWPTLNGTSLESGVKVLFLADTHLLGPRRGHWFDKLRREWQMHRTFQTAITLHSPDAVFILGDVFDEGEWSNAEQFQVYLARFSHLFRAPKSISVNVVPGNHDIGFHYITSARLVRQFHTAFNLSSVQLLTMNSVQFVLVNSMAFEGDNCDLCADASHKLRLIAEQIDCDEGGQCLNGRPILLQHFPMYRKSDKVCNEPDEAPKEIKNEIFREKWDCLSKEATIQLLALLNPRAIFTGHTHHGCHVVHKNDIHEYTIPSFSWRNKNNPSFTMAHFNQKDFVVAKCLMPEESTVILIYTSMGILVMLLLIAQLLHWLYFKNFFYIWPFIKLKNS